MDNKLNIGEDVYDLTLNQLGTALYHIANNTRVSLDYTGKYKQDVQNRASALLCNAIGFEGSHVSIEDLIQATWDDFNEAILDMDADVFEAQHTDSNFVSDEDFLEELCDRTVRQCVSDETVSCYCGLADQLKCEWANDPWEIDSGLYKHCL